MRKRRLKYWLKNSNNTNDATKQWLTCFTDYLIEKSHPTIDQLSDVQLDQILETFYAEVKKKDDGTYYRTSSLPCLRAALTRYFKEKRQIDIIKSDVFLKSNMMFQAMMKVNKEDGFGEVRSYPPILHADITKITQYFKTKMYGNPDPQALQQIVLFFIVYYLCC